MVVGVVGVVGVSLLVVFLVVDQNRLAAANTKLLFVEPTAGGGFVQVPAVLAGGNFVQFLALPVAASSGSVATSGNYLFYAAQSPDAAALAGRIVQTSLPAALSVTVAAPAFLPSARSLSAFGHDLRVSVPVPVPVLVLATAAACHRHR